MNNKDIIDAWATIRKENHSIPDDVLDFMKDSAIEKLQPAKDYHRQLEEKDKEIFELKKGANLLHEAMVNAEQRGVQKGLEEAKQEIARLRDSLLDVAEKSAKEIERLKGLIETAYKAGVTNEKHDEGTWADFEKSNF